MPAPHANFACLGRRCRLEDGGAPVYDLPVSTTRCPVCGSKRVQRLFDAVNIGNGKAKALDRIVEPAYTEAMATKNAAADAVRERRICPPLGVPIRNGRVDFSSSPLASQFPQLAGMGMAFGTAPGELRAEKPPLVGHIAVRPPTPKGDSMRDTEFTIKDGQPARR